MLNDTDYHQVWADTFGSGTKLKYAKGEFIIRPGETPSGVFFIKSGLVKAFDITKYGEENLLVIRKQDEIFPLIWSITGLERDIIYQALSPVDLIRMERTKWLGLVQSDPKATTALLMMTVEMYRIHSERIINLEYRSVRERLISFMLSTSRRFGRETKDGLLIDVPLRQQDIASSINASRETTSRELSGLEKKGLIVADSCILIKDFKKLTSYLETTD